MSGVDQFRKVGLATCIALVLANMIGTGVFTSLGFQVAALPSAPLVLWVWFLGGLIALCGALCYAELAAALPRSGGEYHFLTEIYHPAVGFMAGFVSVTVGFAAPIALSAMAFGKYFHAAWPAAPVFWSSVAVVVGLAVLHSVTVRMSGHSQIVLTVLKVALIVAFIVIGLRREGEAGAAIDFSQTDYSLFFSGPFAISLMFVLYAYTGWNAAAYIIGEVRDPQRTVPWALLIATVIVTVLYVALNAVFLASGPIEDFAGHIEVGEIAARNLLGEEGGRVMSTLISLGLISAVSAMTWAGPRVAQSIGRDFPALAFLSRTTSGGVPRLALLFQTILVLALLMTGAFEAVLVYAQFAILSSSFLAVLGVIVLRWRRPELPRPFRCFGYPWTPLIFLVFNLFAMVYTAWEKPGEALAGLGTLALGLGLYLPFRQPSSRSQ